MNCQFINENRKYLYEFFQILNNMENKMLNAPVTNNITINFIRAMVPHHQAAIYMCQNLLRFTNFEPLEEIARNIISTQTKGISEMKDVAITTSGYSSTRRDVNLYEKAFLCITKKMICRMRNAPISNDINLNFVNDMIEHHDGAIKMCENVLKYRIDPKLAQIANNIIKEQSNGIRELEEIGKTLYSN